MVKIEKIKPAIAAERGDLIWRWILVSDGEGMSLFSPSEQLGHFSLGDYSIGRENGRLQLNKIHLNNSGNRWSEDNGRCWLARILR